MVGGIVTEFDAIPLELRERRQWVVWRYEERMGKKPTKVPVRASDCRTRASTTDSSTWTSFDDARDAVTFAGLPGIGYVFTADDPYVGIDLDDGLSAADRGAIMDVLDSYAEASVSGNGVHVIVRASLNGHGRNRRGPFEVYETERYFCMTGAHVAGTPATIEPRQAELEQILERFLPAQPAADPEKREPVAIDLDDRELLERAFSSKSGTRDPGALQRRPISPRRRPQLC